ncbi:hypothetical protein T265_03774 [Opisthorchis viverrini]|uniref:Uncharacterized protein n=1 Tax=Opisthorchis viverrini TaxID=6198 RepID=A0A075A2E0_OPIVI|nr:hypothetical protein T265_03774 [Opisthorchis viverrini]KER29670.1 hypothetical protein T265_03774 [Opisthorchis viverrini]
METPYGVSSEQSNSLISIKLIDKQARENHESADGRLKSVTNYSNSNKSEDHTGIVGHFGEQNAPREENGQCPIGGKGRETMNTLKIDENIVILPTDKRRLKLPIDKLGYTNKPKALLSDKRVPPPREWLE